MVERVPIHPFDLQARAAAAAGSLTALLDPARDGLMYFLGEWRTRPPVAYHGLWDFGDGTGRHIDALTLARSMVRPESPAAACDEGEEKLEAWLMRLLQDDGLSWLPTEPWAEPWGKEILLAHPSAPGPYAEISWAQRGTLLGLTSRFLRTRDERYLTLAQRLIDGLLKVAMHDEHGLFFPEGYFRRGGWRYDQPGLHPGIEEYNAAVAIAALRFYEATGYDPAMELARGLVASALYHTPCYLPDGRLRQTFGELEGHFHTHSNFALSVLKLGLLLGRREYVSWARQTYAVLRSWGTDFGWFPEGFGQRHGEVCCITDMLEMALLLGRHVDRAYYADAECFGRNHLLESQFLSLDRLQAALDRLPPLDQQPSPPADASTTEGVAESQVGGFASRSTLNDAFHLDATALMQCCNAAGTRALYDLWRYAVDQDPAQEDHQERLMVNLRFSVETPTLRVISFEPSEGRLDLSAIQPCQIAVRLPSRTTHAVAIITSQDGTEARAAALPTREGYVDLQLRAGESATLRYPLLERMEHYEVGTTARAMRATAYWRGETVMRIEPPGVFYPLYERSVTLEPVMPSPPGRRPISSL